MKKYFLILISLFSLSFAKEKEEFVKYGTFGIYSNAVFTGYGVRNYWNKNGLDFDIIVGLIPNGYIFKTNINYLRKINEIVYIGSGFEVIYINEKFSSYFKEYYYKYFLNNINFALGFDLENIFHQINFSCIHNSKYNSFYIKPIISYQLGFKF